MTLEQRRKLFRLALVHKCLLGRAPQCLYFKFANSQSLELRTTRSSKLNNLYLERPATNFYHNSQGILEWTHLQNNIKNILRPPLKIVAKSFLQLSVRAVNFFFFLCQGRCYVVCRQWVFAFQLCLYCVLCTQDLWEDWLYQLMQEKLQNKRSNWEGAQYCRSVPSLDCRSCSLY